MDPALQLTARRPDRFGAVREEALAHRQEHACNLETLTEIEARELATLVRATHSSYVLEIGTGSGYSALHIAATFGATGRLDTVESDARHAELADAALNRYALHQRVRIHRTAARDVVPALSGPYDLILLDADWALYPPLYNDFVRLLRVGGSLYVIPREGFGANPAADPLLARIADDDRLLPWFAPGLRRVVATRVR